MGNSASLHTGVVRALGLAALALLAGAGCKGGGHGGGGSGGGSSAAALPSRSILTTGGEGVDGDGGDGGRVLLIGRPGGDVHVRREPGFDASFETTGVRPSLGANPCVISTDAVLTVGEAGIPGDADPTLPASGLLVREGATLTLLRAGDAPEGPIAVAFEHAVIVEGGLFVDGLGIAALAGGLLVEEGGRIVSSGPRDPVDPDSPLGDAEGVFFQCTGTCVNRGTITARGQAGGGNGGTVALFASPGTVESTGTIDVSGGASDDGPGGPGGIAILAGANVDGFVGTSGTVLARGGEGGTTGGAGGLLLVVNGSFGLVSIAGLVDLSGGAGHGVVVPEEGPALSGGGGGTLLAATPFEIHASGRILSRGGAGALEDGGAGGSGGLLLFLGGSSLGLGLGQVGAASLLALSADLDTRGGRGARGGAGGPIVIAAALPDDGEGGGDGEGAPSALVGTPAVVLTGYSRIDASGGASSGGAGGRGAANLAAGGFDPGGLPGTDLGSFDLPGVVMFGIPFEGQGGAVACDVSITARGGAAHESDGQGGQGGAGGQMVVSATFSLEDLARGPVEMLAPIDLRGGAGLLGGAGGKALLASPGAITVAAGIDAAGGAGETGDSGPGRGGRGGFLAIASDGALSVGGPLRASGGACTGTASVGGGGGWCSLLGASVRLRGDVLCAGGPGEIGGDGGAFAGDARPFAPTDPTPEDDGYPGGIVILSTEAPSDIDALLSVAGGAGSPGGGAGRIAVDGHDLGSAGGEEVLP